MKKIIICLISIFLLVGCSAVEDKIYLTDKYYDNSSAKYIIKTGIIKKIDTVYKIIKIDNIIRRKNKGLKR